MKKIILITFGLFTTLFFLVNSPKVSASENNDYQPFVPPETMEGSLISDSGETMIVVGNLVEEPTEISEFSLLNFDTTSDLKSNSASYEFEIYSTRTGNLTVNQSDSTLSVRVILTINYTESTSAPRSARVDRVSGSWTRLDPTVLVSSRTLTTGSTGPTEGSPGYVEQYRTFTNVPSTFNYTTGFTRLVNQAGGLGDVGANLSMTISRGSSSWTLRVTNNLF